MTEAHRLAAACGILGVVLNLVAVGALQGTPHTYKPGHVDLWLAESLAAPGATMVSAWAFTVGLALLVPFCVGLARRDGGTSTGAAIVGIGALLDAVGTFGPVAAIHGGGQAFLWFTLLLDSCFNFLSGLGLLAIAAGMRGWPRGLRALAIVAGLASLPVALQFQSDAFAGLLAVSGPLWCAWIVWASVALARA
ncbi:MAG: hypothetical protein JWM80_3454 [Cyanobacteria bacterium RYN_339]|nr:hypothetical protein [Cyanobacteria bacterium RYN_339]